MGYPYFNPYPMYPQQPQQQQNSGINWVNSDVDAANFFVLPNNAVTMWNSNGKTVYLKQTDSAGKPTLKIYDLVERTETTAPATQISMDKFATKEELAALVARIDALSKEDEKE